jgi:hypothetical protein
MPKIFATDALLDFYTYVRYLEQTARSVDLYILGARQLN